MNDWSARNFTMPPGMLVKQVATIRELNNEDGLHPNARGYEKIVNNLSPHVLVAIDQFKRQEKR